mgnify:CR=1 FL=1
MLSSFLRDRRGNVLPIFAVALVPLLVATGGAVDYTNAQQQRGIVQAALDSAVLAAGKKIGLMNNAELQTEANKFYVTNIGNKIASPPALATSVAASTITGTTTLHVPTYFLGVIGLNEIVFDIKSSATLAMGTIEVAMVLDNSGSMDGTKISTLKTAATNLVNTVFGLGATSTKPDPVKVALVPFAGSVNIGSGFQSDAGATWLDKTGVNSQNQDVLGGPSSTKNGFALLSTMNASWGGCVEARPMPYDVSDDPGTAGTPATMFVPMVAADSPDNWTCSSSTCSYTGSYSSRVYLGAPSGSQSYNNYLPDVADPALCGNTVTMTIANPGVITTSSAHHLEAGDRVVFNTSGSLPGNISSGTTYYVKTVSSPTRFTVSTTNGGSAIRTTGSQSGTHTMTASTMWTCTNGDDDCDGTGRGESEATAFARMCKYGSATRKVTPANITVGGLPGGPNFMCSTAAVTPLTTSQSGVTASVNAMVASGSTNIQEGLMWGWRLLSPGAPFTGGRAYTVNDNQKIIILMTDGENTYYPKTNSSLLKSWYGAWGFISQNHLGTTSTSSSTIVGKMNDRTALACTNAKAAGIKIYTVAFQVSDSDTLAMLTACASEPAMAFQSSSTSALLAAFSAIGDDISLLRVAE